MISYDFQFVQMRFHFQIPNEMILIGWFKEDNPENRKLRVFYGKEEMDLSFDNQVGITIRQKYIRSGADVSEEIRASFVLPCDWKEKDDKLKIISEEQDGKQTVVRTYDRDWLVDFQKKLDHCIDVDEYVDGQMVISGWAAGAGDVKFTLKDAKGSDIDFELTKTFRRDVQAVYEELPDDYEAGFKLTARIDPKERVYLTMQSKWETDEGLLCKEAVYQTAIRDVDLLQNANNIVLKGINYFYKHGLKETIQKTKEKLTIQKDPNDYTRWRKQHEISKEELDRQYRLGKEMENGPKFSIVIPLYQTGKKYLREMIDSVLCQTYPNFELCLADGSGKDYNELISLLDEYCKKDQRVRYEKLSDNYGISDNTNAAIKMATGDYIVLADHDDLLAPNALYECAMAISKNPSLEVIYSDEDKVDMNSKSYFEPNFKPDFNLDLLCSMNYICHLFVVKKTLLDRVGYLDSKYDGAQDHDFILRCCDATEHIYHVPMVLYHWRCHPNSTAENPESKMYAFEAGKNAVQAHYDRHNIPAKVDHGQFYGMYKTTYCWEEQPLISIIIPNKDHIDDLKVCMESIHEKSTYRNFEFIVVENNSTEDETFAYYEEIKKWENVTVLYYEDVFNYSKINNFGVKQANGEYILLLNNDTEMINPDALWEMLGYAMREDVGIVGARLYYQDDTIQHAGVVMGYGGIAGHTFIGCSRYDTGYMNRIVCAQDYSAVTAACLMTKKSVYDEVGGLTQDFQVAFNDIDYCLKVRELGKLVVYNPAVEFYHYESKSRGLEDTPEKVERFNSEADRLAKRWADILKNGDPYYNRNLSLDCSDFKLKN